MKWTDEKPSEKGWYWWNAPDRAPTIVAVRYQQFWEFSHGGIWRSLSYANPRGKWSGPIPEPDEPSTIETGIRPIEVYPVGLGSREEPPTMVERTYKDPDLESSDAD